mmetsp:Transcript_8859/g.7836  ORF Transcript_8859/g.7836 Transcript_8859/m.7836 type:complete len:566 (+) Transcript_8859:2-1699(+)
MDQAIVNDNSDSKELQEAKKWEKSKRGNITTQIKTRSKVQGKESVRPTVISSTLIAQYIRDYNRENKIFDKDDLDLWDLDHMSLSYQNIIDIDNLKGMEKLKKLQLDNNIIYKIQNLDHLTNLEWLDLSFNQIEKIEGLGSLNKLTDLSLYNNHIEDAGNLEKLLELNVLSLGENRIKSYENVVTYLREIPNKLEVLTLEGNPCIKKDNKEEYQLYVYAYLDKLQYLDYHIIKQESRNAALEKHREDIDERDNQKEADKNVVATPTMSKERRKELMDAHIISASDIFKRSLGEDEIIQKFVILPNYQDIMLHAEDEIREKIDNFITIMLKLHENKEKKIVYWTEILRDGEREAEKKSITNVDEFKVTYIEKFKGVGWKEPTDIELDIFEGWTYQEVDVLEEQLMSVEMKLVEALGIATGDFGKEVDAINNEMVTESSKFTKGVQEDMDKFIVELRDHAYKLNEELNREDDNANMTNWDDQDLVQLLYDKETLTQYFEQSKETQENKISEKDNIIRSEINNDWKNTKEELLEEQHDRNRNIIQEIIKLAKDKKKEVSDLVIDAKDR